MHEALNSRPAAWVAPAYKFLLPNWREVCETLRPAITAKSEEEKHICIAGGGEIDFWTADGGSTPGEGRKYGLVIFDECAQLGADLERLWTRSLRPTLSDLGGSAWFLSTSKAASSFFTTMFSWGQGERDDWRSWQLGTADNPFISGDEIESARRDLRLRQHSRKSISAMRFRLAARSSRISKTPSSMRHSENITQSGALRMSGRRSRRSSSSAWIGPAPADALEETSPRSS